MIEKMYIDLHVKDRLLLSDFSEIEFVRQIFKNFQIPNFMKIRPVGVELFHAQGRKDMKLIATFRNSANVPKNIRVIGSFNTAALKAIFRVALRSRLSIFYLKRHFNTFPVPEDIQGVPNDCNKKCMDLHW